ncbi:DUF3846 domain-containing protein [Dorea sp. AF24-7LB]|uniref:DUF3846 domain-containing protein n=1 Tax=Dorea sp. AF24-7LB TaxID=2293097 RepID=UPI000E4C5968|nr:DUF3846 domain-containing protein [Dorea sp. AF24-7LB]RHQ56475.1 DUF3846 domain-containing protein [Dorea sp. AF24-7LB]
MKTLKITTDNKIRMIDINMSDYKAIQKELGGHFETVHTKLMYEYYKAPVIMLVDEEGLWKQLPLNVVGSYFYGTQEHGNPIAGDVLLALVVGEDFTGFTESDARQWMDKLLNDFPILEEGEE